MCQVSSQKVHIRSDCFIEQRLARSWLRWKSRRKQWPPSRRSHEQERHDQEWNESFEAVSAVHLLSLAAQVLLVVSRSSMMKTVPSTLRRSVALPRLSGAIRHWSSVAETRGSLNVMAHPSRLTWPHPLIVKPALQLAKK